MSGANYRSIVDHYESCLEAHGDTHKGVDWPDEAGANVRYRVMLDVIRGEDIAPSLLDFGCGASHLYAYLTTQANQKVRYTGLDLSEAFCDLSRRKFPENRYLCIDVLESDEDIGDYDYVIMNGVFTEKRDLSFDDMFDYFKRVMLTVYPKVRKGLAFNAMSKNVDWERPDLFHLPIDTLNAFLTENISRNVVFRADYGLYEYTTYVYREVTDA